MRSMLSFVLWGLDLVTSGKIDALTQQIKIPLSRGSLLIHIPSQFKPNKGVNRSPRAPPAGQGSDVQR
jgi:hypothetical protein